AHLAPSSTLFPYTTLFRSLYKVWLRRQKLDPFFLDLCPAVHRIIECTIAVRFCPESARNVALYYFCWMAADAGKAPIRKRYIDRSEEHTSELQSRFDLVCR